jgi:tRNA(fMet)-specific endonuclease VapC
VVAMPMAALCVSVITEGELLFDLAKWPRASRLQRAVSEFLGRVDVLAWDSVVAERYGVLRAGREGRGRSSWIC